MKRVDVRRTCLVLLLVVGQCTMALHDGHHVIPGFSDCAVCAAHASQIHEAHPQAPAPAPSNQVAYRLPSLAAPVAADRPRPAFRSRAPPLSA